MNVAAGFNTGFSFYYSSSLAGSVTIFDGLNGTGTQLAQVNLGVNFQNNNCTGDPTGLFCNWDPIGVSFAGTAKSVLFGGVANQVGFDSITLGSNTPGPVSVPEPSSLFGLLAVGFLGVGSVLKPKLK
ncbi:PEP-CTERM sorting domain-containing protein [Microcystis aeruginosa]|nr:PEP-CTERM sorting domain-containing protein [Microcystis aeruginosa]